LLKYGVGTPREAERIAARAALDTARKLSPHFEALDSWESPSGKLILLAGVPKRKVRDIAKESLLAALKSDGKLWDAYEASPAREGLEKAF
jgi:hypothetical protein